ncbi:MAG: DUF1792 domain-containing protein [Lachnospiraceae bacterium]|nr:DUF1792 domain-containing protein [Lachnospiraceae bacterium]
MKRFVKDVLAWIDYCLYRAGIKKCAIKVCSVDETIDELIHTGKSMVRFGDGEITMIRGKSLKLQQVNPQIIEELKRIVGYQYDDLMVTIPNIFEDLSVYRKESRQFWRDHLLFSRGIYEKYCNASRIYGNTSVSRFYFTLEDKSKAEGWVQKIREIWKDKDVVVVEGARTHNGVGNDLLDTARTVERIIGPSSNAHEKLDEIVAACKEYPKDRLFLVSLGAAAKPLTEKLFLEGYRVLDIGNLDMEYEWYLNKATSKEPVKKHSVVGIQENEAAGYHEYLKQIQKRVE